MAECIVRASFRKQVSDGNFGNETAELSIELHLDDAADDADQVADELLEEVRAKVHAELLRSPNANVRRAIEPRKPTSVVPVLAGPPPAEPEDEGDPVPWR